MAHEGLSKAGEALERNPHFPCLARNLPKHQPFPMADSERHPFLQGLSKHRGAPPTVVVIFGASGDLTARKLIPAIYNLSYDNLLPADFHLVGYGRKPISDGKFRKIASEAIKDFSRRKLDAKVWARVAASTSYVAGEYDDKAGFVRLAAHIGKIEKAVGSEVQSLFYISTPPSVFEPIIRNLGKSGLGVRYKGQTHHSKVIIEKPFGTDLDSARSERHPDLGVRGGPGVSDRPLPGQGDGAGPPGPALRQLDLRADLEPQLHRQRPDHGR